MKTARWRMVLGAVLGSCLVCCALVYDPEALGSGAAAVDDGGADTSTREDDAAIGDATGDAKSPPDARGDRRGPTGLNDDVSLADLDATPCTLSSTGTDRAACGSFAACRFATADSGRCESCDGRCTGHLGQPCTHTWDCDSVQECFRGECANPCEVGNIECGKVVDCLDVGYLGGTGICDPRAK